MAFVFISTVNELEDVVNENVLAAFVFSNDATKTDPTLAPS